MNTGPEEVLGKVREVIKQEARITTNFTGGTIGLTDALKEDVGLDSLDLINVVMALEREFDFEIEDEGVEQFDTVGDLVACIEQARCAA